MSISLIRNIYLPARSLTTKNLCRSFATSKIAFQESETRPAISIAQSCVDRLKKIAPEGSFLRISIDGGGCQGFQYRFDLDSKLETDDVCFEKDGAKVVVDKISLDFLKDSTIEFHEELIRSAFRIVNNPQADSKCSCGASFSAKM